MQVKTASKQFFKAKTMTSPSKRDKRPCAREKSKTIMKSLHTNKKAMLRSENYQHPSSKYRQQRQKMVRFSKSVDEYYDTIHITDFSLHERESYWYQHNELEYIQIEIGATILAMARRPICKGVINPQRNQQLFAKGFLCSRGLEGFRPETISAKTKHISQVWDTVMEEQYKQLSKEGKHCINPKAISYACRKLTRRSVAVARLRAISDERDCLGLEEGLCLQVQKPMKITGDSHSKGRNENSATLISTTVDNHNNKQGHKPLQYNDSGAMPLLQQHAAQNNNKFMIRRRNANRPSTVSSRAA